MIDDRKSPLRDATFRRVWIGATVSAAGDAASWVALVAYALSVPHGSVATLAVLYTAPVALGGLVAGWALDRYVVVFDALSYRRNLWNIEGAKRSFSGWQEWTLVGQRPTFG